MALSGNPAAVTHDTTVYFLRGGSLSICGLVATVVNIVGDGLSMLPHRFLARDWVRAGVSAHFGDSTTNCSSDTDGGACGRRSLVEGVGNVVHGPSKIAPGETLDPFWVGRCRRLASFSLLGATCGSSTLLGEPVADGGIRDGGAALSAASMLVSLGGMALWGIGD